MRSIGVIGGGGAGLATVKALSERGIPVVCYERGSNVGGNWRYENDSGTSAAYASLRCNISRRSMQFRSFPMPPSYGDFPTHADMTAYFEAYTERFDLRRHIRFSTTVARAEPRDPRGWRLTLENGETVEHEAIVVANGHHWSPQWPRLDGRSTVPIMHAQAYRTPDPFAGQRVLVIGAGQSAVEVATEVSQVAKRTLLSVRTGTHVIPRYLFGRPFDWLDLELINRLPWRFINWLLHTLVQTTRPGDVARYGLHTPPHRILEHIPAVSSDLFAALRSGAVVVKPGVEAVHDAEVRFTDGASETVDAIVCATGYRISCPFLPRTVLDPSDHAIPLYRRIVPPEVRGLYFIGLIDAPGGLLPIVETQASWLADLLAGTIVLPEAAAMWAAIDAGEHRSLERFPGDSPHTIRCDPHAYTRLLTRDRRGSLRGWRFPMATESIRARAAPETGHGQ